MTRHLEQRLNKLHIELLACTEVEGIFAGNILRLKTNRGSMIYKQYGEGRDSERVIYEHLADYLKELIPVIRTWDDAVLMTDCGAAQVIDHQTMLKVMKALRKLYLRHIPTDIKMRIPVITEDHIELDWLKAQVSELNIELLKLMVGDIEMWYNEMNVIQLPLVLTHGDCHRGNIFINSHVQLIDWERAGFAVPVRDITMLLQDTNTEAVRYKKEFYELLQPLDMDWQSYSDAFDHYLLINTVKMMVWEIGKFQLGHQSKQRMMNALNRKFRYLNENLHVKNL